MAALPAAQPQAVGQDAALEEGVGGIMSPGVDGIEVAEALGARMLAALNTA